MARRFSTTTTTSRAASFRPRCLARYSITYANGNGGIYPYFSSAWAEPVATAAISLYFSRSGGEASNGAE
jgi:hypothetical protein